MGSTKTRTRGIHLEKDGSRTVDKQWQGQRIFARLGQVSQDEAEQWLSDELVRLKAERDRERSAAPLFAECAGRYLREVMNLPSAGTIAWHIKLVLPYLGKLPITHVHDGSLEGFKEDRLAGILHEDTEWKSKTKARPVKASSVNRTLEVVRTILNRSARAWRGENGRPLLDMAPPLITMLDEDPRLPYPITWTEQDSLMAELPAHLQRMALFDINTGLRDENVVGLRWNWEVPVPQIGRSIFIIPPEEYKTKVAHVVILNDVAWSIIEGQRGQHRTWVFPYTTMRGGKPVTDRMDTMNNTAFQNARDRAGLKMVRVHDLRHTFGARLRLAGVAQEDRNCLLGHGGASMPEHYASADIGRLVKLANRVTKRQGTRTLLRVVNG